MVFTLKDSSRIKTTDLAPLVSGGNLNLLPYLKYIALHTIYLFIGEKLLYEER